MLFFTWINFHGQKWPFSMFSLNSRNFRIFHQEKFYWNFKIWIKSALKIIQNDIDIAYEVLRVEKQLLRGRNRVGGKYV